MALVSPRCCACSPGLKAPTSGAIKLGHNVVADYFAQDQYKVLRPEAQMLDDITGSNPRVDVVTLRSLLGCFMFTGDDVFKRLGVLSGGERNRYALAKMLVSPANFLLLDEPTNHLDMRAKDVLLEAVHNFSGTVLFVSHDRYFIDGLATRVFEVEERRVHIYPGNYEDYMHRKTGGMPASTSEFAAKMKTDSSTGGSIDPATGMFKAVKQVGKAVEPPPAPKDPLPTPEEALAFASVESTHEIDGSLAPVKPAPKVLAKRLNPLKLKQIEDRVEAIEEELPELEARISQAEQQQGVFTTAEAARALAAELDTLRDRQVTLTSEWEELATQLEEQTTA